MNPRAIIEVELPRLDAGCTVDAGQYECEGAILALVIGRLYSDRTGTTISIFLCARHMAEVSQACAGDHPLAISSI